VAASHHGDTPYSGNSVTSVPVTPYTTSVDVNATGRKRLPRSLPGAYQKARGLRVDLVQFAPRLRCRRLEVSVPYCPADPGVVDQDVRAADGCHCLERKSAAILVLGQIRLNVDGVSKLVSERARRRPRAGSGPPRSSHRPPVAGQCRGQSRRLELYGPWSWLPAAPAHRSVRPPGHMRPARRSVL